MMGNLKEEVEVFLSLYNTLQRPHSIHSWNESVAVALEVE